MVAFRHGHDTTAGTTDGAGARYRRQPHRQVQAADHPEAINAYLGLVPALISEADALAALGVLDKAQGGYREIHDATPWSYRRASPASISSSGLTGCDVKIYLDTSALIKRIFREEGAAELRSYLHELAEQGETLITSRLTDLELGVRSLLAASASRR